MKKTIITLIVTVIVAVVIIIATSNSKPSETGQITFGAALSLTGDASSWGEAEKNGIDLAVKEINAKGGVDGKTLAVSIEDTKSSSQNSVSTVQKLVNFDKLSYIIGPTWLDSYPGAQGVVKGTDTIMVSPSASITAVQSGETVKNVFSTWYRVDSITDGLAKAIKEKGKTKVALVFQNDSYYTEFIAFFKKAAEKEGVTIVSEDLINPGLSDFKTIFSKIKAGGADGVVFGMYDEKMTLSFLKDHTLILSKVSLFSNEVIRQYISNPDYKPYIEGALFVENAQLTAGFVDTYKKAYGTDPVFSASTAYDTVNIFADVMKNGAKNPTEYLHTHSFETVSFGKITFDSLGGVVTENKQYQIREVKNGTII
jgi:branched-chain amino acid transport system substrate-binding protein